MIYLELFLAFFQIGLFTFGGGYAMIPLIQEQVAAHGWLEQAQLVDFIAISESTPGPFAINIATYVGAETGGILGSVCATLGVVLPSFVVILLVARFYERFKNSRVVSGCMAGLRPAVVGLIAAAIISVAKEALFYSGDFLASFTSLPFYLSLAIFAGTAALAFTKKHPVLIVAVSAAAGIALGYAFNLQV